MHELAYLAEKLNEKPNVQVGISAGGQALDVKKEFLVDLLRVLKHDFEYIMLADLTAADYSDRFEVIYHLMQEDASMIRVKVVLQRDNPVLPSIVSVWKAADVQEREVFDLMGIIFDGHGNLKRILCKDDFEGHPLRKDFKLDIVERF